MLNPEEGFQYFCYRIETQDVVMMLHRSASSHRRRASRGTASSSSLPTVASSAAARGRRASVATDKPIVVTQINPSTSMERQRSPRGSVVPDINLDSDNDSLDEVIHDIFCKSYQFREIQRMRGYFGKSSKSCDHFLQIQ